MSDFYSIQRIVWTKWILLFVLSLAFWPDTWPIFTNAPVALGRMVFIDFEVQSSLMFSQLSLLCISIFYILNIFLSVYFIIYKRNILKSPTTIVNLSTFPYVFDNFCLYMFRLCHYSTSLDFLYLSVDCSTYLYAMMPFTLNHSFGLWLTLIILLALDLLYMILL